MRPWRVRPWRVRPWRVIAYIVGMIAVCIVALVPGPSVPAAPAAEPAEKAAAVPIHHHLLKPSAEWAAQYEGVSELESVEVWSIRTLIGVARQQAGQIKALEVRVADLETGKDGPDALEE